MKFSFLSMFGAAALGSLALLSGCGGGGSSASGGGLTPDPDPAEIPAKLGRLRVNVESGHAVLMAPDGRAFVTGAGASVVSSGIKLDSAERSRYYFGLFLTPLAIGGLGSSTRILMENVTAGQANPTDLKPYHQVSTHAGIAGISGASSGPRGVGTLSSPRHVRVISDEIIGTELAFADSTRVGKISPNGSISYLVSLAGTITDLHVDDMSFIWATLSNHTIARVHRDTGAVTIIGSPGVSGHVAGTGATARFNAPRALGKDFVLDANGFRAMNFSTSSVQLASGSVSSGYNSVVAREGASELFAASYFGTNAASNNVAGLTTSGTLLPPMAIGVAGSTDGRGNVARFSGPADLDQREETLFVADTLNHRVRQIRSLGADLKANSLGYFAQTIAGGAIGSADGLGSEAQFSSPSGICVASSGRIFVADTGNHTIRMVSPRLRLPTLPDVGGTVSTEPVLFPRVDGIEFWPGPDGVLNPVFRAEGSGSTIGLVYIAILPEGTNTFEADLSYIVADQFYAAIPAVQNPAGTDVVGSARTAVRTVAGRPGLSGFADGAGAAAAFGIALATEYGDGALFVADEANGVIRTRDEFGVYRTIIGDPFNTSTTPVNGNGTVEAGSPSDLAVSLNGRTIWWVDRVAHVVRKAVYDSTVGPITNRLAWTTTTLYGSPGTPGDAAGTGATARLNGPRGISIDSTGSNLYVADTGSHRIKRFLAEGGPLVVLAGSGAAGSANAAGTAASFNGPQDLTVGPAGDVFVADTLNRTIRRITPGGSVSLLAGQTGAGFLQDGANGAAARFHTPSSIACDATGMLYVVDQRVGMAVRRVSPTGQTRTVAGLSATNTTTDGWGSTATFGLGVTRVTLLPTGPLLVANGPVLREVHAVVDGS
jgi:sugar lactone lactonase YvrE